MMQHTVNPDIAKDTVFSVHDSTDGKEVEDNFRKIQHLLLRGSTLPHTQEIRALDSMRGNRFGGGKGGPSAVRLGKNEAYGFTLRVLLPSDVEM